MIKELKPTKELLKSVEDSDILDTMYDDLVTAAIYKKYPIEKQLAILNRDKTDPRRIAYEEYILKCKAEIADLLKK